MYGNIKLLCGNKIQTDPYDLLFKSDSIPPIILTPSNNMIITLPVRNTYNLKQSFLTVFTYLHKLSIVSSSGL